MGLRIAAFLAAMIAALPLHGAQCAAESGPGTAALVELYTAEHCPSCPWAERWLSTLASRAPAGQVVPLALYVDYGYYVGLPRQRKLSPLQTMALVYTPQVLLQGRDFRHWGGPPFDEALARINARPARANLRLEIVGGDATGLDVEAKAALFAPVADGELYIAAYGGLERPVVLEWEGPFSIPRELSQRRRLPLLPGTTALNSGVAAFVQDRRTGEVLQALLRPAC